MTEKLPGPDPGTDNLLIHADVRNDYASEAPPESAAAGREVLHRYVAGLPQADTNNNASHELPTPPTELSDVLRSGALTPDDVNDFIGALAPHDYNGYEYNTVPRLLKELPPSLLRKAYESVGQADSGSVVKKVITTLCHDEAWLNP